ncbi:MAG: hypothetical protein KatS3mg060_1920 [Dehalococcoidia bacterium]|nr:MAG: hypothetical protein KatS3mg060_1920 [Dehalococcoidia bacterium]
MIGARLTGIGALVALAMAAAALGALLIAPPTGAAPNLCDPPGADKERFTAFLHAGCHRSWPRDQRIRQTGPVVDGLDFETHGRVRLYYSPEVYAWLKNNRQGEIPDGAIIVKEQYPADPAQGDTLIGYTAILKQRDGSWDGWFWLIDFFDDPTAPTAKFGYNFCLSCHASADDREVTFASLANIEGPGNRYTPADTTTIVYRRHPNRMDKDYLAGMLITPLQQPDRQFLDLFGLMPPRDPLALPPNILDHVPAGPNGPRQFLTSDQCFGCHDATDLLDNLVPNMQVQGPDGRARNLSPYGEWSASLMGLSGRDPVFHAQLEAETTTYRPGVSAFTQNLCYRCHGAMGQRQIHLDGKGPFQHEMVYATSGPNAIYGALARDGVSCAVCHHVTPEGLGSEASFSGNFNVGPPTEIYGPYEKVITYPMEQALGITPKFGSQISSSALCGSCHTVILPKVPTGYQGDPTTDPTIEYEVEQATYLEWRNSAYQNEIEPIDPKTAQTCQGCHMPQTFNGKRLRTKIANIEDNLYPAVDNRAPDPLITLTEREPFSRHTLVGINLFVMQMFQQFRGLLGIETNDDTMLPRNTALALMTAAESSLELARTGSARLEIVGTRLTDAGLETTVRVTNLAGHKLPSGVGFRRAWLEFTVLDASGRVLWASGRPNALGVITGPDGAPLATEFATDTWQPHYQRITQQDHVQIYEERTLDDQFRLTTSFLARFYNVKDNRLLPKGWKNDTPGTEFMQPEEVFGDERYFDGSGSDEVVYVVPREVAAQAGSVRVVLHYQSIPPYYLRDRFRTAGPETGRLAYLASHLQTAGTPIEGWTLRLAEAAIPLR